MKAYVYTDLHGNALSSFIYNLNTYIYLQKKGNLNVQQQMNSERTVIYPYSGILLSNTKGLTIDTYKVYIFQNN